MKIYYCIILLLYNILLLEGCSESTHHNNKNNQIKQNITQLANKNIKKLQLTIKKTKLNRDENTTLKVIALCRDGSKEDVTTKVEWIESKKGALQIKNHTLTALKDVNATLQAKYQNTLSNPLKLSIYWRVNGHRLPPEPDPAINNATLLGVDINNNGVRDDVERWIYNKYKDKHPIHIDIAMQEARADRFVLEKQPKTKAEAMKIKDEVDAPVYCELYYSLDADEFNDPILIKEGIANKYFRHKVYFNTKKRMDAYIRYDSLLSGDSYTLISARKEKAACDFNTSKYDKE